MGKLNVIDMLAMLLVVVGAVNWGLVGLLNVNLVSLLVGSLPMVEKAVYIAVGVAGVYTLITMFRLSR